jgi:excisionase family DNA binding protein
MNSDVTPSGNPGTRESGMSVAAVGERVPAVCTIADVCRHLNVSRKTVERRLADRTLPIVELDRIGRLRRFTGESVQAAKTRTRWARPTDRSGSQIVRVK